MRGFALAASGLVALAAERPAVSQINAQSTPLRLVNDCLSESIARGETVKKGEAILFTCRGGVAKAFFDTLGHYGVRASEWTNDDGTFRIRKTEESVRADYCLQKVAEANGLGAQGYSCTIGLDIGPFLNR